MFGVGRPFGCHSERTSPLPPYLAQALNRIHLAREDGNFEHQSSHNDHPRQTSIIRKDGESRGLGDHGHDCGFPARSTLSLTARLAERALAHSTLDALLRPCVPFRSQQAIIFPLGQVSIPCANYTRKIC